MNEERLHQVLVEPRISEKATRIAESHRQFVFRVLRDATKPEIKAAVEKMFKVEVKSVRTLNVRGRVTAFRRAAGRRPGWKKAFVTLKEGHDINFLGIE
jgi:large subunit ribosomal protein L23